MKLIIALAVLFLMAGLAHAMGGAGSSGQSCSMCAPGELYTWSCTGGTCGSAVCTCDTGISTSCSGAASATCGSSSSGSSSSSSCDPTNPDSCCSTAMPTVLKNEIGTWYCPINYAIYTQWQTELPVAIVAVLLAFSIASLIVMVGIAFKSERMRNFGIAEIYEATASAIIVGIFLYVCTVMFGVTPSVFVGSINPYSTALNQIPQTINDAQQLFTSMFNIYYFLRWFTTQQILFTTVTFTFPIQGALSFIDLPLNLYFLDPARAISFFLVDGILALWSEYYLIVFFSIAAIPAFIVPGVVFRTFLPTRALGGVMMAIGIAFYLVMPTLFSVAFYLTSPQLQSSMMSQVTQLNRFGSGSAAESNAAGPQSPLALQLQSVQSDMASFWLLVLFYPTLIIGVVYATILQLANFLGGSYGNAAKLRSFI